MMEEIPLLAAFGGGVVSFISPCVLPLVPAYISFISGLSIDEIKDQDSRALRKVIINCSFFILGFSAVFILFGASATVVGQFMSSKLGILSKVAGVIIIIFGLHTAGVFRIKWLDYEKRFHLQSKPAGLLGSFVVGSAFAFGWTPCVGPILAAILALAGSQESIGQGTLLLAIYSSGLGVPFLLTGIGVNTFLTVFDRIKRHFQAIEIASGVLLVAVGLMIFFNYFNILAGYLVRWFPWLTTG